MRIANSSAFIAYFLKMAKYMDNNAGRGRGRGSPRGGNAWNVRPGQGRGVLRSPQDGDSSMFPVDFDEWTEFGDSECDIWNEVPTKKRQRANTCGGYEHLHEKLNDFEKLSIDEKLTRMMSILLPLDGIEKTLEVVIDDMHKARQDIGEIQSNVRSIDRRLKMVENRAIDLEARSRRNNLLFFNIGEDSEEDCENV